MNRITMSKEARQSLQNARQSLEKDIRAAKTLMRQPGGDSAAQSALATLRKEATLLYSALAASRGKIHCKASEERFEALKRKGASESLRLKYLNPTERLIWELLNAPAPAREAPVAA